MGYYLEHDEYITICSSNVSVFQHDPFSWRIYGNHFVYGSSRGFSGRQLDEMINAWLQKMSVEEREKWVERIYAVLNLQNAKSTDDSGKTIHGIKYLYENLLEKNER